MKNLVFVALSLVLAGCGGEKKTADSAAQSGAVPAAKRSAGGPYKIGIATREITNDFNRDINNNAQAVIEASGGSVVIADANADFQKHNENIENLINSGIDGLIIQLGEPAQLSPIMARAQSRGIPVVTTAIGSPVPGTITDVNGDNPLLSTFAADALLSAVGYKGDIYIVYVPGAPLLETRRRIFQAICADHPAVRLHDVPAEHNPAKVQAQIEDILTANPNKGSIAGIFGTYDQLIAGANEAVRRAGRDEIKVVSIDGDRIAFQMLFQEGSPFVTTVVQDVPSIGSRAAEILLGVLDGKIDPSSVPAQTPANGYVATRKNGVAAAELRWTESFWKDAQLDKAAVEAKFPQTETVLVAYPSVP